MRRSILPVVLVLVVGSWGQVSRGEPAEEGRAWHGILPDPAPAAASEWFVCRVRDAATLEPVPGALWIRTPEWIAPWRLRHDAPLGVARTDGEGVAHLPTTPARWTDDCHWLVVASGYGFDHTYGDVPPAEVLLRPEAQVAGHVLDALGRPVPGATVEALGGCSHGTAAASADTDAEGAFRLRGVDPSLSGQLWVAGPGIAADLLALSTPRSLGYGRILLAMEPGARYRGRVVDLLGAPLPGVVVRVRNEQRGPTTATRADGTFALDGAEPDEDLLLFPPADLTENEGRGRVSDAYPDVPCTVVTSPLGVVEEEPTVPLRIRARDADGRPVGGLAFAVLSGATGRGPEGWTAEAGDDDLPAGEALETVLPGPWRVVPTDPLASHTFDPVVVPRAEAAAELFARPQPRLRIDGAVPPDAELLLAVPGASTVILEREAEAAPWLPDASPAVLRVTVDGRPPFFFRVGPTADGVRRVRVTLPEARLVVLPTGASDARLDDGEREAYAFATDDPGVLRTDASGPLRLRFTDAQGNRREVDLDVPEEPGAQVVVDPAGSRPVVEEVLVRALEPDGGVFESETASPGDEVVFERDGWQTLRAIASATGRTTRRWGPCTLVLSVRDADGPVDAIVLVGGEVHAAPDGGLTLRGLDPGPLRIVVARRDVVGAGRALHPVLARGEVRKLAAVVPLE